MGLWAVADVKEEPEVTLSRWQIYEVSSPYWKGRSRHFVGWCGEGRVSSQIMEFDYTTMSGRTNSGRLYKLSGSPGINMDAGYVWDFWCKRNECFDVERVDILKEKEMQ